MSMRIGWTKRGAWAVAGALAVAAVLAVSSSPAKAGGHGSVFLGFNVPFVYYGGYAQPYPYPPPPAYAYPPRYGYGYGPPDDYGDDQGYDDRQYSQYQPPPRSSDDSYCREFQSTIMVNGRPERAFGMACLQPDGSWRIVR